MCVCVCACVYYLVGPRGQRRCLPLPVASETEQTWFVVVIDMDDGWTRVGDHDTPLQYDRPATFKLIQLHARQTAYVTTRGVFCHVGNALQDKVF